MHTLNLKKFYPFTYLELGSRNAPCFHKKFEKYFVRLWDGLFYLPKKSFHLFGIWAPKRNLFQRKIFEKEQKNLPAGSGEQGILAFPSLNIGEKTFNST